MTRREWKPGDVAMVANHEGTPAVRAAKDCRIAEHAHVTGEHWHYLTPVAGASWDSNPDRAARPLVVIDPEDREQVERLSSLIEANGGPRFGGRGVDSLAAALREFANPTPPKPEEPTGLGAVVEDSVGRVWVFADTTRSGLRWHGEDGWRTWDEINAVRILSEGVPA